MARRISILMLRVFAAMAACATLLLVSGQAAIVVTQGVSMNPVYHEGDLVLIARASSYEVGDIAAYDLPDKNEVALHRIIGGDRNAFIFQGDNNESIDPIKPPGEEIVGRAVLHIPQGGTWLRTLTSPPVLGVVAFGLITAGGTATTRRQRKRRKAAMAQHSRIPAAAHQPLGFLAAPLKVPAALGAASAVVGVTLGVLGWSGPLEVPSTAMVETGTRMDFSYTADVGRSPAYDGTTAESPDPVFRRLADTVDVHYSYEGDPGTVTVSADLSMPGGWHSTVPLTESATVSGLGDGGTIQLDLSALEARAQAAATATGLPMGPVAIALTPEVVTESGAEFRPTLDLSLTEVQLSLAGGPEMLSIADSTIAPASLVPRIVGINDTGISAAAARIVSAVLLAAAFLTGSMIMILARRSSPEDEASAIRRRYAALLVRVHPVPAPQGRPVIDVTTFPTLAKLAERYGLLVLHWSRSGMETFIVQDENITYRYRPNPVGASNESHPDLMDAHQEH